MHADRISRLAVAALSGLLMACGPEFAVVPLGGARLFTADNAGVKLTAFADQWEADPRDLANDTTPIAVDVYNGTNTDVRVSLADFYLAGEGGVRLPAINPFTTPYLESAASQAVPGVLYAARGGHGSGGRGGGYVRGGGAGGFRGGYAGPRRRFGAYGYTPRWGNGFHVSGRLRGYYGPGIMYWGGPWLYPPGYMPYAWTDLGPRYEPSADVLELALPEGVLAPGARVNGFLYFRKATGPGVRSLTLGWLPHDARSGAPLGEARISLAVVRP